MRAFAAVTLLIAIAVAGCGSDDEPPEEPASPPPATSTETATVELTECVNERAGYAIGYPADWHTASLDGEFACSFFDPEPFEILEGTEFPLTALQAYPAGELGRSFEDVVAESSDPMFWTELEREEATVSGFRAVRLTTEATGQGLYEEGTRTVAYIVDRDVAPFVVSVNAPPGGDVREDVLEEAVRSLRFFEPQGATTTTAGASDPLPAVVEETRIAIAEAAAARDFEALEELIPESGFTYTYGGAVEGGPTAYWRQIEEESPERPLEALAAILEMPHTKVDDIYVWPFAYDRDPSSLTEEEREILSVVANEAQMEQWAEFGNYLGWRAGIRADGTWIFFVAGD